MASLDLATLRMSIEVDSGPALKGVESIANAVEGVTNEAQQAAKTSESAVKNAADSAAQSVESASKRAGMSIQDVSKKLTDIGGSMTLKVTAPIVAAFTASVKGASDLNETVSKTGEVFKEQSDQVMAWSERSIETMGLAQGTALDMASTFGDMGTSMGQTRAEATAMSTSLVQLSADLASFKNISTERAQTALTAIYTGETESLKSLGIVMTQANLEAYALSQGITTQISAMSQAEQVQLRYQYVMAQTANAQGDFVRTGGSLANQSRKLMQSVKQLGESLGGILLPVVTNIVTAAQGAVQWLTEEDGGLKGVVIAIGAIVAAIGPLLLAGGKVLSLIGNLQKAMALLAAHPVALAVTAATAALGLLIAKLNSVDAEAVRASDAYAQLKASVEGGASGTVQIDASQIDALNEDPPTLRVNGDVSDALAAAKGLAEELTGEEYAANVAIGGDTEKGRQALAALTEAIEAAEAAVTIDGDGNPVIGDQGVLDQLEAAIAGAEGILPIGVNDEQYADVTAKIAALRSQLAALGVNIEISSDKAAFDARVDSFKAKLDELGWKRYGGFGEFTVSESTTEEIDEYATAIAAAAQAIGDYDDAVSNLDSMVDRKVAQQTGEINAQSAEQVMALGRAYNSGVITYDEYIEKASAVYEAGQERIRQIQQQAELEKELNQIYADGNAENDAPTAAAQSLKLIGDEGLNTEDYQNAAAVLTEAAAAGESLTEHQTEAMIVNRQLAQQAQEDYDAMIAAREAYESATDSADENESTAVEDLDAQIETYQRLQAALDLYIASVVNGTNAAEAYNNVLETFPDLADALSEALGVGEDGVPTADYGDVIEGIEAANQLAADAEASRTEIQTSAENDRQAARQAFADAMTAITGDMTSEELQLLLQLTGAAGVAMDQMDQEMVLGMQAAAAGMADALASGKDGVADEASDLIAAIGDETGSARSQGVPVGEAIVNGIIAGCNNRGGSLSSTIRSLVRAGINAGKAEGQIYSPSRVTMQEIGEPLMEGVEVGFTNRLPEALKTIRSGMDDLMTGAAQAADYGTHTTATAQAAGASRGIDYERLAEAMDARPLYFNVGARQLARATSDSNARTQAARSRSVAIGYGKG